jgi:hypothetical protein
MTNNLPHRVTSSASPRPKTSSPRALTAPYSMPPTTTSRSSPPVSLHAPLLHSVYPSLPGGGGLHSIMPPVTSSFAAGLYPYPRPPIPPPSSAPGQPCTDPFCRDPTCPTTALRNAHLMSQAQASYAAMAASAAAGMRSPFMYPGFLSGMPGFPQIPPPPPTTTSAAVSLSYSSMSPLSSTSTTSTTSASSSAHVCSWMNGKEVCGRRFSSGEDLMSHLRTHTAAAAAAPPAPAPTSTSADPTLAALQAAQAQAALFSPSHSALAALQAQAAKAASESVPTTSSSARYHPYGRPGVSMDPYLGGLHPGAGGMSPSAAAAAYLGLGGVPSLLYQ